VTINNIEPRRDVDGKIIDAHGGCLQFFDGRFYLYGTAFGTNENGLALNCPFRVYSSPDLERWTYEGELLKERPDGIYFRPCVVFNPHTHQYVLWYNWFAKLWNGQTAAATSDTPVGPFKIANPNVQLTHPGTGDGSLFVDDDGTGYYIYTAIGGGYTISVERLTPDYLGATGESSDILGVGGEAPVLFRRNNLYYALFGARCADCREGSEAQVFVSHSPLGPFTTKPQANINRRPENSGPAMSTQATWVATVPTPSGLVTVHSDHAGPIISGDNVPLIPAQQTWVAKIPMSGEPLFIWMGDRWESCPDGIKGHDFQFWSAPLKFSPDGDILPIQNIGRWDITWAWSD
jgi:beta-xylosidase